MAETFISSIRTRSAHIPSGTCSLGGGGFPFGLRLGGWRDDAEILTAGFPCQPVSIAGKRLAQADPRWLWPEVARMVRALRPRVILLENTPGLLIYGMGDVLRDLAACGYDASWRVLAAADVGAPHLRERLWIVAYPRSVGRQIRPTAGPAWRRFAGGCAQLGASVADANSQRLENRRQNGLAEEPNEKKREVALAQSQRCSNPRWPSEPAVGRVADGVPHRVDRLRALGNAVVPQVVAALVPWIRDVTA